MFIDVHTHLWPPHKTPRDMVNYFETRSKDQEVADLLSADGLLRSMEKNDIERSVVAALALNTGMKNDELKEINRYVSRQVTASDGRLTGLCTVDPWGGSDSLDLFKYCVEELGFRGLKIHPSIQAFHPNEKQVYPLYAFAQKHKLPVLVHTGGISVLPFRDGFAFPHFLDDVGCDFPELFIILGHGGRIYYDQTAMMMRKHKNMYADISTNFGRSARYASVPLEWLLQKVKVWAGSLDKVLFGSDFPFYLQDETLSALRKAQTALNRQDDDFVSDEDMNNILYGNFQRCCDQFMAA